ncbi:MAG: hypothetical protein KC543_14975, partial [Myxococcales bacterium]|nr:hypothetical protein [Myxococcales bacterium]
MDLSHLPDALQPVLHDVERFLLHLDPRALYGGGGAIVLLCALLLVLLVRRRHRRALPPAVEPTVDAHPEIAPGAPELEVPRPPAAEAPSAPAPVAPAAPAPS